MCEVAQFNQLIKVTSFWPLEGVVLKFKRARVFFLKKQKFCLHWVLLIKTQCVNLWGLMNVLNAFSALLFAKPICWTLWNLHCLNPCVLANCLTLPCLWCQIAAHLGALSPPVDQCNSVKPLAGLYITSPTCTRQTKLGTTQLLFSTTKNSIGYL